MGCGLSRESRKIQRSTAIEILDEAEYKLNPNNASVAKFKSGGQEVKIHFRTLCANAGNKQS
jgi:hypothetical protein